MVTCGKLLCTSYLCIVMFNHSSLFLQTTTIRNGPGKIIGDPNTVNTVLISSQPSCHPSTYSIHAFPKRCAVLSSSSSSIVG